MLPETENGLVLLVHLGHHLYTGLGLRQVLDWMMYCHNCLDAERWNRFRVHAQKLGLERLALVVTRLCVKYFGLQASWCGEGDGTEDLLMDSIIRAGNFGKKIGNGLPVERTMINFKKEGIFRYLQRAGEYNWGPSIPTRIFVLSPGFTRSSAT